MKRFVKAVLTNFRLEGMKSGRPANVKAFLTDHQELLEVVIENGHVQDDGVSRRDYVSRLKLCSVAVRFNIRKFVLNGC